MTRYPANTRVYDPVTGSRLKWAEHGRGLLPSYLYSTAIEQAEEQARFWATMAKQYPTDEQWAAKARNAKRKVSRLHRREKLAKQWDAKRDEREAEGRFW